LIKHFVEYLFSGEEKRKSWVSNKVSIMAESDEWATVETVEDDVFYENQRKPTSPVDTSTDYLNDLFTIVSSNAWFIVLVGVALYFLWQKFKGANSSRSSGPQLSPDEVYARQEAMESIRRKMQEQYDLKAQEFAVKQKEVRKVEVLWYNKADII